jgi:hypothetical protein
MNTHNSPQNLTPLVCDRWRGCISIIPSARTHVARFNPLRFSQRVVQQTRCKKTQGTVRSEDTQQEIFAPPPSISDSELKRGQNPVSKSTGWAVLSSITILFPCEIISDTHATMRSAMTTHYPRVPQGFRLPDLLRGASAVSPSLCYGERSRKHVLHRGGVHPLS